MRMAKDFKDKTLKILIVVKKKAAHLDMDKRLEQRFCKIFLPGQKFMKMC